MQFLYPGFLWGLLAIGVPVAIHLLQLRRPQRVLFTNTGFIREVELTTMRRRRLQELLVLLMRVLGVVFMVLLFAQPFVPAQREVDQTSSVSIALDTSLSMQVMGENQQPLLQEATSKAAVLGKNFETATHFRLLGQPGGLLTQAVYLSKVADERPSGQHTGWTEVLSQNGQKEALGPLYVFSDFQRSPRGKEALQAIPKDREVVLVPQQARPAANVYVDSMWLEDAFVRTQVNIGLHIRLKNGGSAAITDCPVKVRLGKQQVAAFRTTLAVGQASTIVVQVQLTDRQLALGQVLTEDQSASFDNAFYFTLQPTATIRVVEIGNEPVAQQAYQAETTFAYSFTKPQQVNFSQLQRANLVLVQEITAIDAGLQQALVAVVRHGGSVVIVPSGGSAGREATLQLLRVLGVAGAQWSSTAAATPVLREVAMPSPRNPFFREVFGPQPRQVALPQVAPVLSLGRSGTDILRLRDGDSYLAEFRNASGPGRTYVFTAPFSKEYGDFAAQGLFVPVLYRMAMLSYQASQQPAYRLTVPTVALELAPENIGKGTAEAAFRLVHDSLTLIPAQRLRGTSLQLGVPATMSQPGFYELRRQGRLVTTLAFNADPQESELAAYSVAELRQLVGPDHPNVQVLDATAGPEALMRYRAAQTGQPLWRYCLLAVLVCLLAEALLLRFGRPQAAVRPIVAA